MDQEPDMTANLDVNEVIAELGRAHIDLAARGSTQMAAELAQLRVLARQQAQQIQDLRGQIPPSATGRPAAAS